MICRKCREWAAKGAAHCQRCKRSCRAVDRWDKFLGHAKRALLIVVIVALLLLSEWL